MDFETRHPDWESMQGRWRMARSFSLGGIHVLSPDWVVSTGRFGSERRTVATTGADTGTASEISRNVSDYEWTTSAVRSFLWKHDRESPEEFADRQRRMFHYPIFRSVLNVYVSGIMRDEPVRGGGESTPPLWEGYWRDVDRCGTRIDTFVRRALSAALAYGRVHALTDMPSGKSPVTVADMEAQKARPYSCLVTPLQLVDWSIDDDGEWRWAVIEECGPDVRAPGSAVPDVVPQYRVLYPDRWEVWRQKKAEERAEGGWVLVEGNAHPCGRVPLSTLWATEEDRLRTMACESPLADVLDLNRHNLNKLSELDEVDRAQAFALLGVPSVEGQIGSLDIGPRRAVGYDSAAGAPAYINPDPQLSAGFAQRIDSEVAMGRQLASTSRGRAEYSKEERSAASLTLESADKGNQMAWWSASTEEFERSLYEMVCRWSGLKPTDHPEVKYRRTFDLRSTSQQILDLVQLKSVVTAETAIEIAKPIVSRMMMECGKEPEEVREIVDGMEPPPPPIVKVAAPFGKPADEKPTDEEVPE